MVCTYKVVLSLKIRIAKTFYLACAYALFMNPCRELFKNIYLCYFSVILENSRVSIFSTIISNGFPLTVEFKTVTYKI